MKSIKSLLLMLTLLASNTPTLFAGKLYELVKAENIQKVQEYLKEEGKTEINTPDNNGETPFLKACEKKNLKIVTLLLEKGAKASINTPANSGSTPLYWACINNKLKLVKLLLKNGAKASINTDNNGETPLHLACGNNNLKLVTLLLLNGAKASINTPNKIGSTPLFLACYRENFELADLLLQNDAKASINTPNNNDWTPLFWACAHNNLELADLLLQNGAKNSPDKDGLTPLFLACDNKNLKLVTLLLQNGADATIKKTNGETPISTICSQSWTTEQRIELLMSLIPTEPSLQQYARIFIELVIAALAEEMSQSATVAPKVRLTDSLFTMTNAVTNPSQEIARIEEFVKILLFKPRQKNKIYTWPENINRIEIKKVCPAHFTYSPAQFEFKINFGLKYEQYLFLRELLKFTQAAKRIVRKQ